MSNDLQGKVAVVTGGTRGIGAAIARALLGQGATVVICGRHASAIAEAVEAMKPRGRIEGRVCDVRRFREVQGLFWFVNRTFAASMYSSTTPASAKWLR